MKQVRIGLLGPPAAPTVVLLGAALRARGAEVVAWDPKSSRQAQALCIDRAAVRGGGLKLDELAVLYVTRGYAMSPVTDWTPSEGDWAAGRARIEDAVFVRQEARSLLASAYRLLSERCRVVNSAAAYRSCALLPALLRRLADSGLPVAKFVSGNDLEQIAHFVHEHRENCRGWRLGQPSRSELRVDLDYLRDHHLDFDRFPLLVRETAGGAQLQLLVVGGRCVASLQLDTEQRWSSANAASALSVGCAERAASLAGLAVSLVHIEQRSAADAVVVGLDPQPDLAALDEVAQAGCVDAVARLLVADAPVPTASILPKKPTGPVVRRGRPLRVGIVGRTVDSEAAAVARALLAREAEPVALELPLFPELRAIHEAAAGSRIATTELEDLDAVYLRTVGARAPPISSEPAQVVGRAAAEGRARFARMARDEQECFNFKYALLEQLGRRIPVVNPAFCQEIHRHKVHQLFSLRDAGFPVPDTWVGSDPEQAAHFVAAQGGPRQVVVKPLAGLYKTRLLSDVCLQQELSRRPLILQRYLQGDVIRAYVVGHRLVGAARIEHARCAVDSSVAQTGVERVTLPSRVAEFGAAAARHLGLAWSGMDLIRETDSGEYVILECNASAMFHNFSLLTGCDVAGALAEHLIELGRRQRDLPKSRQPPAATRTPTRKL